MVTIKCVTATYLSTVLLASAVVTFVNFIYIVVVMGFFKNVNRALRDYGIMITGTALLLLIVYGQYEPGSRLVQSTQVKS